MKVLLTSHGSTGDIYPAIRLGRALARAGHEVRYATVSLFREEIERAGITYVYLPPDWDEAGFAEAMRDLNKASNPLQLLEIIYAESLPFLDEVLNILERELRDADVFVSSYLFAHMSAIARKRGVPAAVLTFAHNVAPSAAYPPDGFPRLLGAPKSLRRAWNRTWWRVSDAALRRRINRVVGEHLDRHGIERARSFLLEPADRALVTVSPSLFRRDEPLNERFVYTGYLRWQAPEDPEIDGRVAGFRGAERVPILTFGSVTFEQTRKIMTRFMRNWPEGEKIVIQSGWAGLTIERPPATMLRVGRVSHDQLFRHASMVIHHGGAGTTASALHAGVPQIVIPHIADQGFFAREVERLGAGRALKRRKWPEDLPAAVRATERDERMRARAAELAGILANEDGPGNAVAELERLAKRAPQ